MEMLLSSALSHGTAGIYDGMALVSTTTVVRTGAFVVAPWRK